MKGNSNIQSNGKQRLKILRPFQEFLKLEASGGILLMAFAVIALLWANSAFSDSYANIWQTRIAVLVGDFGINKALLLWVNDGLMAIFFFLVGLEIKRELLIGELASFRRAALPIAGALGGLLVPAIIYAVINVGTDNVGGWGVPIATDIAFALGILALLGDRVPMTLKVFLTALAIVDDISAVLVIAVFYTTSIQTTPLIVGFGILVLLFALNRLGVQRLLIYVLFGIVMWVAFLQSGIHATIAGVLLAATIPATARIGVRDFVAKGEQLLQRIRDDVADKDDIRTNEDAQSALHTLEVASEQVQPPLLRAEHSLHPWVAFAIIPIFALANAGVRVEGDLGEIVTHPVAFGIILGLVIGKPVGITLFSWLAVRSGLADKPTDVSWRQINGVSWLGGVGFTMSLFIANLAFDDATILSIGKMGILVASVIAGTVGWLLLRRLGKSVENHSD